MPKRNAKTLLHAYVRIKKRAAIKAARGLFVATSMADGPRGRQVSYVDNGQLLDALQELYLAEKALNDPPRDPKP